MKPVTFFTFLFVACVFAGTSAVTARAEFSQDLIVTVQNRVPQNRVQNAIAALVHHDPSMGTCYFEADIKDVIPADATAPYRTTVIVHVVQNCAPALAQRYFDWLERQQKRGTYQLWSNPEIDPDTSTSGRNRSAAF